MIAMTPEVRIDKYLWAIRVFKTRSEAADACKTNKVYVNGSEAKSSRNVKEGDIITVRKGAIRYQYQVLTPIDKRQGAALVPQYAINKSNFTNLNNRTLNLSISTHKIITANPKTNKYSQLGITPTNRLNHSTTYFVLKYHCS